MSLIIKDGILGGLVIIMLMMLHIRYIIGFPTNPDITNAIALIVITGLYVICISLLPNCYTHKRKNIFCKLSSIREIYDNHWISFIYGLYAVILLSLSYSNNIDPVIRFSLTICMLIALLIGISHYLRYGVPVTEKEKTQVLRTGKFTENDYDL